MKTTYSMGVIDWSSDVCSSDLGVVVVAAGVGGAVLGVGGEEQPEHRGGGGGELSLAGQHLGVAQSGRRGAAEARLQQRSGGREPRPQHVVPPTAAGPSTARHEGGLRPDPEREVPGKGGAGE